MEDEEVTKEELDPFNPNDSPVFNLVAMMRLYDVGMALLNEQNPEAAAKLHELHEQGKVLGSFPWLDTR
jgi:hypothetical protein